MALVTGNNALRFATSIDNSGLKKGSKEGVGILGNLASGVTKMDVFGGLAISAGLAFKKIAVDSYNLSTELETAMKEVQTISQATQDDFEGMKDAIVAVGTEVPQTAVQLTEAFYQIASAGFDGAQGLELLDVSAKSAVAGITDTKTAADVLTTAINAWGLQASDATMVSDQLFQAVKLGKTTFEELAGGLSQVASIASVSEIGLDEILSGVSALTKQGVPTAQAFTQIRSAIISTNEVLGDGWTKSMSMQEGFAAIADQAGGSTTELKNMVGRVEAMNGILGLTGQNAEEAARHLDAMGTSTGAASDAFEIMVNTTENQIKLLEANVQQLMLKLGDYIKGNADDVIAYVNNILTNKEYQPLLDVFLAMFTSVSELTSSLFDLADALGVVDKEAESVSGVFEILAFTTTVALTPLKALIDSLTFLSDEAQDSIGYFVKFGEQAVETFNEIKNAIKDFFSTGDLSSYIDKATESVLNLRSVTKDLLLTRFGLNEEAEKLSLIDKMNLANSDALVASTNKLLQKTLLLVAAKGMLFAKKDETTTTTTTDTPSDSNYLASLRASLDKANVDLENLSGKAGTIDLNRVANQKKIVSNLETQIKQQEVILGLSEYELKAKKGSLAFYNQEIAKLQEKRDLVTTDTERADLQAKIESYKELIDAINGTNEAKKGSVAFLEKQLSAEKEIFNLSLSDDARKTSADKIKDLEEQIKLLKDVLNTEEDISDEKDKQRTAENGSVEYLNRKIALLQEELSYATSDEARTELNNEIELLEKQANLMTEKKDSMSDLIKEGVRLNIELKKESNTQAEINALLSLQKENNENIAEQFTTAADKTAGFMADIASDMNSINEGSGAMLDNLSAYVSGVSDIVKNAASGNFLGAASSISAIAFTAAAKKAEKERADIVNQNESLNNLYDDQNTRLEEQLQLLQQIKGVEIFEGYADSFDEIDNQLKELEQKASDGIKLELKAEDKQDNRLKAFFSPFSKDKDKQAKGELTIDSVDELRKIIEEGQLDSDKINVGTNSLATSYADQYKLLKEVGVDSVQNIEDLTAFLDNYDELLAKQTALKDELYQTLTTTTSSAISDSILDGFANGKLAAEDFAGDFESLMKNAILESFKIQFLDEQFSKFYDAFGEATRSGEELTESEINSLQEQFNQNIEAAQVGFDQFDKLFTDTFGTGLSDSTDTDTTAQGISGEIAASLTEKTGTVLAGTINSIKLYVQQIVEAQSSMLNTLISIDNKADNLVYLQRLENIESLLTEQNSLRSAGTY